MVVLAVPYRARAMCPSCESPSKQSPASVQIQRGIHDTRDPESFAADAAAIGPTIIPKKLAEAVKAADVVFWLSVSSRTGIWRMRFAERAEADRVRDLVTAANEQNFDRLAAYLAR